MSHRHDGSSELALADAVQIALRKATQGDLASLHPEYVLGPGRRLDLRMCLKVDGQLVDFAIELLGQAYPRDIAGAIALLKTVAPNGDIPVIPMIAAEELSPGARELLRQEGIAYFDRQGTLYLRWRHWIIDIRQVDAKSATKPKHGALNLFTGARAGVVLAILHLHGEWMQVTELADLAQTTGFTCSKVLQELEALEWCESEGSGRTRRRRLIKPNALLDAWAQAWPPKKEKRSHWYCFAPPAPGGLQKRLSDALRKASPSIAWAFTGAAPANVHAPTLTAVSDAEIIVLPGQAERFANRLGLEPADKGFNVTVIERDASSLLFRTGDAHGLWRASPFILYLDLLNGRGRNKELAANVRATMELGTDGS
ncbi:MAG: type IV toxin-antitoxin system AbiEi family antitoxin [Rhodanobacter sp.]